jgi:pyridoxine 5-phosphate synthase
MTGLAVKIDQVATLRESRKTRYPDPVAAAVMAEQAGADAITVHLREDRRHLQDRDIRILREVVQTSLVLEMTSLSEMVGVALDIKPDIVILVPEKREQLSPEGGLELIIHKDDIRETVDTLQNGGIPVGLFIDPDPEQIKLAHRMDARLLKISSAAFCTATTVQKRHQAFARLTDAVKLAHKLRFRIIVGSSLCYNTIKAFHGLTEIDEFSIGHSIISRALLKGMDAAIKEMIGLIQTL